MHREARLTQPSLVEHGTFWCKPTARYAQRPEGPARGADTISEPCFTCLGRVSRALACPSSGEVPIEEKLAQALEEKETSIRVWPHAGGTSTECVRERGGSVHRGLGKKKEAGQFIVRFSTRSGS